DSRSGKKRARRNEARCSEEPSFDDGRNTDSVRIHHQLQQLLRVRRSERRPGEIRWEDADTSMDDNRGRSGQQAEDLRYRCAIEPATAGRAHLPPSLRRGLEHGDSLGWLFAL